MKPLPKGLPKEINLGRWLDMDQRLAAGYLHIRRFAEEHGVDERTIQRDLATVRKLGHKTEWFVIELDGKIREWAHRYAKGVQPMFTRHVGRGR
jgi:predicted DNA-binding transcriptional regulator YafY